MPLRERQEVQALLHESVTEHGAMSFDLRLEIDNPGRVPQGLHFLQRTLDHVASLTRWLRRARDFCDKVRNPAMAEKLSWMQARCKALRRSGCKGRRAGSSRGLALRSRTLVAGWSQAQSSISACSDRYRLKAATLANRVRDAAPGPVVRPQRAGRTLSWRYSPEPRRTLPNWPDRESRRPVVFTATASGLLYEGTAGAKTP